MDAMYKFFRDLLYYTAVLALKKTAVLHRLLAKGGEEELHLLMQAVLSHKRSYRDLLQNPDYGLVRHHSQELLRLLGQELQLNEAYSQEGEDLFLTKLLGSRVPGFYVDVGAHHPARYSNTYLLYKRGWRGINIDATPGSMKLFDRLRPDDINIESFVSSDSEPRTFFLLSEPALNTASEPLAQHRGSENPDYRITDSVVVRPRTLAQVLDESLPENQHIDLLSVDVEGGDLDVLRSNDWSRYRPGLVMVEALGSDFSSLSTGAIADLLAPLGYVPIAKFVNTIVYQLDAPTSAP